MTRIVPCLPKLFKLPLRGDHNFQLKPFLTIIDHDVNAYCSLLITTLISHILAWCCYICVYPRDFLDGVQGFFRQKALGYSKCTSQTAVCRLNGLGLEIIRYFLRIVGIIHS